MDDNTLQLYLALVSALLALVIKLIEAWVETRRRKRANRARENQAHESETDSQE